MNENYFLTRRSCRNFKSEPIDDSKLKEIIEKAAKAPTCGNMQLYSIIVTRDKENLKTLSGFHFNQPAATTAPVILSICADFNRFTHWCEINGADAGFDNFHSFITAMTDAVILAQQIVTVAESEGLGTCYLGTVVYNAKEISEFLELPQMVVPVVSLSIGYPACEGEKTDRLASESIIHYERYKDASDEDIKDIFAIHDNNPDNYKFIKENNKDNLAQVFAEVRYPKESNEKVSELFKELILKKGFVN